MAEGTTRPPRRLWLGTHRIDIRSPVPKYSQLRTILLDVIAEAAVDDPAPSERELMARFGVARMTVRKAVDHLVAEGRLYRVQGKGTYVARPKIEMPLRLSSFTEDMRARGLHPGSRELDRGVVRAGRTLAASLQVGIDAEIVVLERLRLADDVPMAIERCHVPAAVAPGLESVDLTNRSLYAYLEQEHGIVLDAGEQLIEATVIDPADARVLAIPPSSAVLLLTRRSSSRGVPVEYVVSTYRADRYQLRSALDASIPNQEFRRTSMSSATGTETALPGREPDDAADAADYTDPYADPAAHDVERSRVGTTDTGSAGTSKTRP